MDLIAPNKCIFCSKNISSKKLFCDNCKNETKVYQKNFAIKIGKKREFLKVYWPHKYSGEYRRNLLRFKFNRVTSFSKSFATVICDTIDIDPRNVDAITWVPMTKSKEKLRGYNQAELIAKEVAKITGIPLKECIVKIKDNEIQHTLKYNERQLNVKNAYQFKDDINGQKIIIVDDIITTGATISECTKTLLKGGAKEVVGICCASSDMDKI